MSSVVIMFRLSRVVVRDLLGAVVAISVSWVKSDCLCLSYNNLLYHELCLWRYIREVYNSYECTFFFPLVKHVLARATVLRTIVASSPSQTLSLGHASCWVKIFSIKLIFPLSFPSFQVRSLTLHSEDFEWLHVQRSCLVASLFQWNPCLTITQRLPMLLHSTSISQIAI